MILKHHIRANKGCDFYWKTIFSDLLHSEFHQNLAVFTTSNCTEFNQTHSFLEILKMMLPFKSVLYWRGYGSRIYQLTGLGESSCVFPISVTIDTATSKVALHDVPSFGHSIVFWLLVIFQAFFHSCGDDFSGVSLIYI